MISSKSLLFISLISSLTAHYDIDDSLLYKIDFQPFRSAESSLENKKVEIVENSSEKVEKSSTVENLQNDIDKSDTAATDSVIITSVDKEKFKCQIPKVVQKSKTDASDYTGPDALGLLENLFVQSSCAYRAEPYWTYELCHGKHLRQYHEEREGKSIKMQEYFLGKFTKEMFDELKADHEKDVANGITRHPPTKNIEKIDMPYYEIMMTGGTTCDLTGLPRRTRVMYTCYPSGRNEIYSFKEVSTCEYEVVVLTSSLCQHPSYRPVESKENLISCTPVNEDQAFKPKKLHQIEVDSLKLRTENALEALWTPGDKPGQVKIEIRKVQQRDPEADIDQEDLENVKSTINKIKENQWKAANRQPFKPLMDPEVVKQFLKGDYCLYGGMGWWKYEFCYGKKVDQYHEEAGGKRTVINLGHFNLEDHLAWLEAHPIKRPKEGDARKQVSLFYSNGDVCDLTGKPRQIEVKLKCKPADSPSTVSLYLLEPKTCEYVLGVESPLVCDLLPHADSKTGLFPVELVDNLGTLPVALNDQLPSFEDEVFGVQGNLKDVKVSNKKVVKKTSYRSTESGTEADKSTKVVEESVEVIDGAKTTIKRTIVDGVIIDQEKIQEKDGVVVKHSQVFKEEIDQANVEYETMEVGENEKEKKDKDSKDEL